MRFVAFLGLLAIAACSTSAPRLPSQNYQAPTTSALARGNAKLVSLPPDAAAAQALSALGSAGLTPDHVDLGRGIIVATYSGDPEGFVDCGSVRFGRGGRSVPASRRSFTVNDLVANEISGGRVERDLRLDSRLVITAQPFGTSTGVGVDAMHVLTKTVAVGDQVARTETIAFDNQDSGRFRKGTTCRTTGKLEELALAGVPGPMVRLAGPQTQQAALPPAAPIALTTIQQTEVPPPPAQAAVPTVGTTQSTVPRTTPGPAVAAAPASQPAPLSCAQLVGATADQLCEVLMLLAPYRTGALSARLLEGDQPLRVGDDLVLELNLPGQPTNLQLSHVDSTGVVTHLPTLPLRGDVRHSIYATGLAVTPPAGQEMFLVMASGNQPLGGVRPQREPLASYAAALRQGLSQRDVRLDAAAVVVDTLGP